MDKTIKIYRLINGIETVIAEIANDNTAFSNAIMGKNEVVVDVVTEHILDVAEGDYIRYNGIKYKINRDPEFTDKSDVCHEYSIVFEHPFYTLIDKLVTNKITGSTKVVLTGTLRDWAELIIWNVNKTADNPLGVDTGWTLGHVPDTDYKTIILDAVNCRDAVTEVSTAYYMEYYFNDHELNFIERIENARDFTFIQGKGKGLYEVEQKNVDDGDVTTRVFPVGGTDNVIPGEGDEEGRLILPERYLENFSESTRAVEKKVIFNEIHPTFTGEVETPTGNDNREFTCSTIDFNVQELAVGDEARINFLTGDLMGKSFEFQWDNESKKITLIYQEDDLANIDPETGTRPNIPSSDKFLRGGEKFNFTGIKLSESYKSVAIAKLREKGTQWLEYNCRKRIKFELSVDHRYMRGKGDLFPGDLITVKIPSRNIEKLIRITSVEKNLRTGKLTCVVSNYLDEKWEDKIKGQISSLESNIASGGAGNPANFNVIEEYDERPLSDKNVLSSFRSIREITSRAISKLFNDTVMGVLTFLQLQYFRAGAIFGKDGFLDGLAGFGAKIGADGRAIMRALTLWEWLEVPEFRYNRVDIYTGIGWRVPGGGIVESVDVDTDASGNPLSTGTVHLKLEKGEIGAVSLDDISLAIYHYENDSLNASADSDDSRGNFSFAGFGTSYFRITEVLGKKNASFRYSLRPGYSLHPQPQMHFSCYGNFTNKDRQTSVYATRTYTRMLWKQNTWEIGVGNIAKQSGDLSNLNIHGLNLEGYSEYCNSVYFTGTVTQIKPDGTPVRTANDRMAWAEGHYDYYDRVSHNGRIWLCVNENGTTSEPAEGNADWLNEVDKGADGDSVSFKGQWRTGLHVPYLGIVRMGTSSWMCNVRGGTDNPPMWCYTDHAGNRLAYSDGGYVLTGETNTVEYELVATDGLQGLQGTNGQDGIPGTPGKDGATTYFHIKYAPVSNPTAEQMSEEPDVYIGTYVDFVKEDSDVPSSYSWARFQGLQGAKGEQGIPGIGVDGKTYYLHIKYSNDGGRTFTGNNGEDTGAYIGVLTDLNVNDSNTPGDYKWSLIKGDKGDQGDSVSNKGQWRTGLHVPYLGIVRMGTSSWMCNVRGGTDNPPMWCYTDHAGNCLLYSDGGYVLTGETNTAEYELVATDGGDGTDGSDGKNGLQGIQGCIIRRGEWSIGTEWRNDEAATSGTRFLDVALVRDNGVATGWRAYKCKVTHTGSTGNAPGNTTYWEEFSLNTTAIFTSLIIAKDAQIEFMQGNQLLIKKEDGTVTTGLSGSQSGDKVRIWAGGEIPDTARFRVYETGDTYTGGDSIFDGYIKNTGVYAHESRNTSLGSGRYLVDKDLKLYSCSGRAYGETGIEDEVFILPSDSEFIGTIINISNLCFPPYTRVVGAIRYTTVARPGGGTRNADRIHGYPIPLTDTNFVDMAADILSVSFISGFIELMGVPEADGSCGWIIKQINALRQNYVKLEQ